MKQNVFPVDKPIIGMLHLNGYSPREVHDLAKREIEQMYSNGVDAVLAENYYGTADDVAWALDYLHSQYCGYVYGVNILGSAGMSFSLATEYDAKFIQIDSVCGHLEADKDELFAGKLQELRRKYPVFVLGGVRFKYQPVKSGRSTEEDLSIGKERCDAVVVTGSGTGKNTDMKKIRLFRDALGDFPLFVGAGMTEETCREQLSIADGAIVGTWFKQNGRTSSPTDSDRVRKFMDIVKQVRESRQ
ncbi:MAG: hypothetical protein IJP89_00875 [Synergistaceae bacterium]|nr:hypothetical protein [Synergistaceae bacterium]